MRVELDFIKFPLSGKKKTVYKVLAGQRSTVWRALGPKYRSQDVRVSHSRLGEIPRDSWKSAEVVDRDILVIVPNVKDLGSFSFLPGFFSGGIGNIARQAFNFGVDNINLALFPGPVTDAFNFQSLSGQALDWLYNAIIPQLPQGQSLDNSPSYGFDGMKTQSRAGLPVPIFGGERRITGNIISYYVANPVDFDNSGIIEVFNGERDFTEAYVLMALCEGPIESIAGQTSDFVKDTDAAVQALGSQIKINGIPVSDLEKIKVYGRLGNDSQAHVPGFEYLHDLITVDTELSYNSAETYTTAGDDVHDCWIHFNLKNGLYRTRDDGETKPYSVEFLIEAREVGGSWNTIYSSYKITGETRSTIRRTVKLDLQSVIPGPRKYELRVTKLTQDSTPLAAWGPGNKTYLTDAWLFQVDEIRYETLTYPFTALFAVVIEATEQLNNNLSSIEVDCKGLKIGGTWSDNPATIIGELITNDRFGLARQVDGITTEAANIAAAEAFADALETTALDGATEKRFRLDIVIDQQRPALDWLRDLALHMTSFIYWVGSYVKIVPDKADTPVILFNHANIIRDSLQIGFGSHAAILNQVEVQYYEPDNEYAQEQIYVEHADSIQNGDPISRGVVHLPGVIRRTQALRTGRFRMNNSRFNVRVCRFKTSTVGLLLEPGQLFELAALLPGWGVASGRVAAATASTSITFDTAVNLPLTAGTYTVAIEYDDGTQESQDIASHIDGENPAGTVITLASAFSGTVPEGAPFHISLAGAVSGNTDAKPFRVMDMRFLDDFNVEITGREYNVETYDVDGDVENPPNYSGLPDPRRVPAPVENLALSFSPYDGIKFLVQYELAAIDSEPGFIDTVEVYIATSNFAERERWTLDGTSRPGRYFTKTALLPNITYYVKVIPISRNNVRGSWTAATAASYTIQAPGVIPPRAIEINRQGNDGVYDTLDCSFNWVEVDQRGFQKNDVGLDQAPLGFGAESRSVWTRGFLVRIWSADPNNGGLGVIRREFETVRPEFNYTFNMNLQDHNGTPARTFTIEIRAVNIFGQQSESVTFVVLNPHPASLLGYRQGEVLAGVTQFVSENTTSGAIGCFLRWVASPESDVKEYHVIYKVGVSSGNKDIAESDIVGRVTATEWFMGFGGISTFLFAVDDYMVIPVDSYGLTYPFNQADADAPNWTLIGGTDADTYS